MRLIEKGGEPVTFTTFRRRDGASFDDVDIPKDHTRAALIREQRGLCCYCMRQLDPDDMKIEHYLSQKDHPGARLRWPNLLGACRGNEQDTGSKLRHCDASRGHATLTVDPRSPAAIAAIEYGASGAIGSRIDAHRSDLQDTLNLNCAQLREARAAALSGFVEARRRRTAQGTWTAAMLARDLERWRGAGTTLPAFAGYIECWVARRRK